jgi:hypothetical protein
MKTLVCTLLLALSAMTAMAADLSGKWTGTFTPDGMQEGQPAQMVLKHTGDAVTGTVGPDENQQWPISNAKMDGDKLTFDVTANNGMMLKMNLVVEGDHLKGEITMSRDGQTMKAKLDVAKAKA